MNKVIFLFFILFLIVVSGCSSYSVTCYRTDEPNSVLEFEMEDANEIESKAMEKCQRALCPIYIEVKKSSDETSTIYEKAKELFEDTDKEDEVVWG